MTIQKIVFIVNIVLSLLIGYLSGGISSHFDNSILLNVGIGLIIGINWFLICLYFPIFPIVWNKFKIYSMLCKMAVKLPGGVEKVRVAELAIMLKRIMKEEDMPKPLHLTIKDFVNLQTAATYFIQEDFFTVNTIEDNNDWRRLNKILWPYHKSLQELPIKINKQRALVWSTIEEVKNHEENYQIVDDTKTMKSKLLLVDRNDFKTIEVEDFSIYDEKIAIIGLTSKIDVKKLTDKTKIDVLLIVNPGTQEYGPIGQYIQLKADILKKIKYTKSGNKWST